ncbi:hypothetical protein FO441_11855 [Salinicoccus cyprini]|uniref:ABC transporter permease n=1 Tax=Salinicoccus cyprini TaxID=2493691 RepID=A0A558AR32_9STAP|nr:hypothetical protein [Salinicoccus cyprini]TVT26696.1 hypothetical protein FO441_11855 [Salinicoccus cyprini]
MKSATSLLNRTLLNHFLGGTFWLTVLFLIGNILIQPLYLWIRSVNSEPVGNVSFALDSALYETLPFQLAASMIYIVLMVVFLFSYKNKEASIDFMHSMPMRRRKLLSHALIAGVINIIIPLVITAIILFFERYFLIFDVTIMNIVEWFFYTLFVLLVVFAISVFVGFLVSNMFVHMQMVVIVFFLPLVFWGLTVTAAEMLYDGIITYPSAGEGGLMGVVVNNTFPIFVIQQIYEGLTIWKMVLWIFVAVTLIILSYIYYSRSRSESVHYTFNNRWIRDILVAFITISGMLLVGIVLSFALPDLTIVFTLAFGIGAIFSYITQEMFFQGTARIKLSRRSLITTGISLVLFWVVFAIGWQQYTSYIPDESNVESVSINGHWSSNTMVYGNSEDVMSEDYLFIEDSALIEKGISLHQEAADGDYAADESEIAQSFEIVYRMKDGSYVNRSYDNFPMKSEEYDAMLQTLNNSQISKAYDVIYNIENLLPVDNLEIHGPGTYFNLQTENEIHEFVDAYQKAFHQLDSNMPLLINNPNMQLISASVSADGDYYSGNASLYNPAMIEKIMENYQLSDFLGLDNGERFYTVDLADEDKASFFRDYETISFDELYDKYSMDGLTASETEDIIEEVNEGNLDASGDRILLYVPEFMQDMSMGTEAMSPPLIAADEFFMLGIE